MTRGSQLPAIHEREGLVNIKAKRTMARNYPGTIKAQGWNGLEAAGTQSSKFYTAVEERSSCFTFT